MPRRPTARRYASAAFDIARDSGQIEKWADDLKTARDALQDAALRAYLELPKVSLERKTGSLRSVLGNLNPEVLNLLGLLTSRNSLGLFPALVDEYQRLTDLHYNRVRAEVTAAIPLERQQEEQVRLHLEQLLGKQVIVTTRVNPAVVGGIVARVGDRIIDGSLRGRLLALRRSLTEAPG